MTQKQSDEGLKHQPEENDEQFTEEGDPITDLKETEHEDEFELEEVSVPTEDEEEENNQ